MINLTVHGKDNTKQVVKMTNAVTLDERNKPLTDKKFNEKIDSIARSIGGQNFSGYAMQPL